jgi:AraC family transcriptional regulator
MATKRIAVDESSTSRRVMEVGGFRITDAYFPPNLVCPPHRHEWATLSITLTGSIADIRRAGTFDCTPSTIFSKPAGEPHSHRIGTEGARVVVIQPAPVREDSLGPCKDVLHRIQARSSGEIAGHAWQLTREMQKQDLAAQLAIEALTMEILALAVREEPRQPTDGRPAWLSRVHELVQSRFREELLLAEMAEEVGVHPVELSRGFHRHFAVPISAYIRQLRLDWSTCMLRDTDESLSSIAVQAGFADQSHFTRVFKQRFGVTPGHYRLTHR